MHCSDATILTSTVSNGYRRPMTIDSKSKNSVLILNTAYNMATSSNNTPILAHLNGNVYSDLSFEIEVGVGVSYSCGVQFRGNFYIYGGEENRQQVAKVSACALRNIATLPFSFFDGACAANSDQLFLCFDYDGDAKTCHTSNEPTGPFSLIPQSTEKHSGIRSAANQSKNFC